MTEKTLYDEVKTQTPREKRRDRSLESIMAAARSVILEKGQEDFSLREVARRADYSPAALYKYFRDRDALLEAVAMEGVRLLGEYMMAVPLDLPPLDRIEQLGLAYLAFARENPEQFTLTFNRLVFPETSWKRYVEEAWPFTVLAEAVENAVAKKELRLPSRTTPAGVAFGLWCLVHGAGSLLSTQLKNMQDDLVPFVRSAIASQLNGMRR